MPGQYLLNIGFGNFVLASRVVAIVNPSSSPMRRLREDAKNEGRLVDASQGRKTRAILVTDSNHVILSAVSADISWLTLRVISPPSGVNFTALPSRLVRICLIRSASPRTKGSGSFR